MDVRAAFYFDLASPAAYLAAERALRVLARSVRMAADPRPDAAARRALRRLPLRDRDARRARAHRTPRAALGLQPLVWPFAVSRSTASFAMLAATYAHRIGKGVPFALAAFRQAFAGGNALSIDDNVLIAGAACEIHPLRFSRAVEDARRCRRSRPAPVPRLRRSASGMCRLCGSASGLKSARTRSSAPANC